MSSTPEDALGHDVGNAEYSASNITVLEGLEAVRLRPGMYIGSTGPAGLHHLIWEVVDNSVDEAMAGHANRIEVTLGADGSVTVTDDGRGIPTDQHEKSGQSALTTVLTTLHAGGKFEEGAYQVSGGLHGVGVSVVNALSTRMRVEVHRDGQTWTQEFSRGIPQSTDPVEGHTERDGSGTQVTFWPDPEIFTETVTFDQATVARRLREMAFLNKGLEIVLIDQRVGAPGAEDETGGVGDKAREDERAREDEGAEASEKAAESEDAENDGAQGREHRVQTFKYEDGLKDFVQHLNDGKTALGDEIIYLEASGEETELEVAMQWTTSYQATVLSFANTINTHEGGTHEEGFRKALTNAINDFANQRNLLKSGDPSISGEDIREGLTAVISVRIRNPQFEGQTKTKLGNTETRSFVERSLNRVLPEWLGRHGSEGRIIVEKALSAAKAREAARRARELTRRKSGLESGGMPDKLADCSSRNPEEAELFIVEGKSAAGPAKSGRDSHTQAILPIRGKILNVEKARLGKALENSEVQDIITAVGAGIGDDFDLAKVRYNKIVLLADADVDGAHIRTLLLTLFFRHMRGLIEAGYIYVAQPPLYRVKVGSRVHYLTDDAALEEFRQKHPKVKPTRFKGLGEMNARELWDTTLNPETRTLLRVQMEDAARAEKVFVTLMGDSVPERKAFIQANAGDVRFLDI